MSTLGFVSLGVKHLLFIFNFLFVISGIIILTVGAVIEGSYSTYHDLLNSQFSSLPVFLIVLGVIVIIISFFGCCGSVKENYCMLRTFACFLLGIFIMEIAAGIAGYVLRDDAENFIQNSLNTTVQEYNKTKEHTDVWDTMQSQFHCCGLEDYTTWKDFVPNNGTIMVPWSCCETVRNGHEPCLSKYAYKEGCEKLFISYITGHATTLGGIGIGIGIIQLLGVTLSCSLARSIRRNYESV